MTQLTQKTKGGFYRINGQRRNLTINERKRIMGFELNHKVNNGLQGYKQLGNSVIPKMIEVVWDSIQWE